MTKQRYILLIAALCLTACEYYNLPLKPWADEEYKKMQAVKEITVSPRSAAVPPGTSRQFAAQVSVRAEAPRDVTWDISGGGGSSSIDENGLLTVGAGESPGTMFTVTATSVFDPGKSGSALVVVGTGGPVVTVTFDPNGGTWSDGTTAAKQITVDNGGDSVSMPANPAKSGLTFDGWSLTSGGSPVTQPYIPTANTTLYARWKAAVIFDAGGGTWSSGVTAQNVIVDEGSTVNAPSPAPTHSNSDFTFAGWYTAASGGEEVTFPYHVTARITLYARWKYAVTVAGASGWTNAITAVNSNAPGSYAIDIGSNSFSVVNSGSSDNPNISSGVNLIVTGSGTITLTGGGNIFNIPSGVHVTLDGPNLVGHPGNGSAVVAISNGGSFTLQNGVIKDNQLGNEGGGVYVHPGATFTMTGGSIIDNTARLGGGVYVQGGGIFMMTGGAITGNTATDDGGGVLVYVGAIFTMSGGLITGNTA
jgi:uncharacterized repeat protein (TIGR02543 family)